MICRMRSSTPTTVSRSNLRDQTREALTEAILQGDWGPGRRIPLAEVATDLGVSVTPVREALSQLVHEGLVVAKPAQGFFVSETDAAQARQVYPILGALEALAVRSSPHFPSAMIANLESLNRTLQKQSSSRSDAQQIDIEWHRSITSGCDNDLLLDKVEELRRRVVLIELAYMRQGQLLARSVDHHQTISDCLRQAKHREAADLLEQHWQLSVEFIDEAEEATKERLR